MDESVKRARKPRAKKEQKYEAVKVDNQENKDYPPSGMITSKIQEVETPTIEVIPREERKTEWEAIINGRPRMVNQLMIDVLYKDPKITIELPKGSPLIIPNPKPCKDC